MSAELLGARVRRVDMPHPDLLALTLAGPIRGALLIGLSSAARGVGLCERRPAGRVRSAFVDRARSCLEGGRLVVAERRGRALVRLVVERAQGRCTLEALLRGARGQALLRDASGDLLAALRPADAEAPSGPDADLPAEPLGELAVLRAEGARLLSAQQAAALAAKRSELARALRSAEQKLARRLAAIEGDLARASQVDELRRRAGLLLAHLHTLSHHAGGAIELLDESVDPPERVRLQIDPRLGPRRQAEAWFQSARRLTRGAAIAEERARATRAELERVRDLLARAAQAESEAELDALGREAHAASVPVALGAELQQERERRPQRLPYRVFLGSGDRPILVGRGAEDNDRLTLQHARPHDLWLHARDDAGAHVVVPLERGESCPPELLADAATLAAHFSRARGEPRVDVLYAERRYVRKARKAPAGQVTVMREKVFRLALEPARLARLLAAERKAPPQ